MTLAGEANVGNTSKGGTVVHDLGVEGLSVGVGRTLVEVVEDLVISFRDGSRERLEGVEARVLLFVVTSRQVEPCGGLL